MRHARSKASGSPEVSADVTKRNAKILCANMRAITASGVSRSSVIAIAPSLRSAWMLKWLSLSCARPESKPIP